MKITLYLFITAISLLLTGCATSTSNLTPNQSVERTLPYISPGVALATTIVLEQAISREDRIEKAKMINSTASIIESLTNGTLPTPLELQAALIVYLPENKTHWSKYISTLKDIYSVQFNKLNGNSKLGVEVLNAIARGCKIATEDYIPYTP